MKLKSDHKAAFLMIGLIFAWVALYIMLADFYEGIVEANVAVVHGRTYYPYYIRSQERFLGWMICVAVSSLCLAIGLRADPDANSYLNILEKRNCGDSS